MKATKRLATGAVAAAAFLVAMTPTAANAVGIPMVPEIPDVQETGGGLLETGGALDIEGPLGTESHTDFEGSAGSDGADAAAEHHTKLPDDNHVDGEFSIEAPLQ